MLIGFIGATLPNRASAQVYVSFSGGGGSPLSITLPELTFTITDAASLNEAYEFGIGIAVGQTPANVPLNYSTSGSASDWSSSNGAVEFYDGLVNWVSFYENNVIGGLNSGGLIWLGVQHNLLMEDGDTLTYAGGTIGSTSAVTATFVDGSYNVYLISGFNAAVSSSAAIASAVPEPSTYAVILGACALGFVGYRRYRAKRIA